jgi:hypothetical protein
MSRRVTRAISPTASRALLADDNVRSFTTHVVLERVETGVGVAIPSAPSSARPR